MSHVKTDSAPAYFASPKSDRFPNGIEGKCFLCQNQLREALGLSLVAEC